jgi:archaellum component FlaC
MTNTPIQVTTDLTKVLERIETKFDRFEHKLDNIGKDVTDLKVSVVRLEEKTESMDKRLGKVETSIDSVVKDVSDLKGAKSLIVPIIVAVTASLLTLLIRSIPNP